MLLPFLLPFGSALWKLLPYIKELNIPLSPPAEEFPSMLSLRLWACFDIEESLWLLVGSYLIFGSYEFYRWIIVPERRLLSLSDDIFRFDVTFSLYSSRSLSISLSYLNHWWERHCFAVGLSSGSPSNIWRSKSLHKGLIRFIYL